MEASKLEVYGDYMSQPARAVFAFCLLAKIPHTVKEVTIIMQE